MLMSPFQHSHRFRKGDDVRRPTVKLAAPFHFIFSPYHNGFRIQKAKILLPPRKNPHDKASRDESSGMSKYPSRFPGM